VSIIIIIIRESSLQPPLAHREGSPDGVYRSPITTESSVAGAGEGLYLSPMTKLSSTGGGVGLSLNPQMGR